MGISLPVVTAIRKAKAIDQDYSELLAPGESPLSANKVTGYSLNFPIYSTCKPTTVCAASCYYAKGATTWPASLKKQLRALNSCKADPVAFADRIIQDYRKLRLTYLRWNGGGDLFPQSVEAINHIGRTAPDLVLWIVTRIPELAAKIEDAPNVYVHFSLDAVSADRRAKFEALQPRSSRYFYSYQGAQGEDVRNALGASVVFWDGYKPLDDSPLFPSEQAGPPAETVCPLNTLDDITGACESCRRCFDGSAVAYRQRQ